MLVLATVLTAVVAVGSPPDSPDRAPSAMGPVARAKIIDIGRPPLASHTHRAQAQRRLLLEEFPRDLVDELWLEDWVDLDRAYREGRLVDVESDPHGLGIELRLSGLSRVGELEDDEYKQMLLCRLAKPAAGLLYRIAARLRILEGETYRPLEITSMVRTWDYQLRLTRVNSNADRTREGVPPTHVLGLAFDIARARMSPERQARLEGLLEELAHEGELAYYREGSGNDTYHVIALPSAAEQLARYHDRVTGRPERFEFAYAVEQRPPTESPCVTFGSQLEPYSSVCQCELPADTVVADSHPEH